MGKSCSFSHTSLSPSYLVTSFLVKTPPPPPPPTNRPPQQSKRVGVAAVKAHPWLKGPLASDLQEEAWQLLEAERRDREAACQQPRAAAQVRVGAGGWP